MKRYFLSRQFRIAATRYLAPALFATGAFLAATDCVQSAPVYSQVLPAEPTGAFSSHEGPFAQIPAASFLLSGTDPITIRSLRFIGGYGVRNPPPSTPPLNALPPDNFRVVFLEDDNGSPGTVISNGDFSVGSAFRRTPTGGQLLHGVDNPIEFMIDLGDGISLNPQIEYWISITDNPGPDFFWQWARSAGLFDQQLAVTNGDIATGPWSLSSSGGGMWFELDNENIPEPTSFTLLTLALMPVALIRRGAIS